MIQTPKHVQYKKLVELTKPTLVVSTGPAGTGKTMVPCLVGMRQVKEKKYDRVILTRPLLTVESESIGFLPGDIKSKTDPWMEHMLDYCGSDSNSSIHTHPLGFLRGHTFHNTFIIADEMQNSSPGQMKMLLTRVGKDSKLVITGDLEQSDFVGEMNGLQDLFDKLEQYKQVGNEGHHLYDFVRTIAFDESDIMRSEFVKKIYAIYNTTS
jgi:phosphate starvation-inducible protein PhoH and related proteins